MDVNDLFKKLTTNLSFGRELPANLKRKSTTISDEESADKVDTNGAENGNDHKLIKKPKFDQENESSTKNGKSNQQSKKASKKKKNLIQINQEKVRERVIIWPFRNLKYYFKRFLIRRWIIFAISCI